jgi:hypothetical protein
LPGSAISDGLSIGRNNNLKRKGSIRSPNRVIQNTTDNEEDEYRTLNPSPSKNHLGSNRKVVPKYLGNHHRVLKVVQEDDMQSGVS